MPQHKFITKQLIDKGWSEDKKYCLTDEQGKRFLLRVSPIEQYDRKKSEYELMSQVATLGVPMCKPLEFGTSDEGVYSIQTWIDGVDVEENVHNLTCEEQYSYGFEAGRILKNDSQNPSSQRNRRIGKFTLIVKQTAKSKCMKNVLSSTKMGKPSLITLMLTDIYSAAALELISTEIIISAI